MTWASTTSDRYVAGETDVIHGDLRTELGAQTKGIVWVHGSGETAVLAHQNWAQHLYALAKHATVHVGDLGFQTWGSDLAVTRIGQAITQLRTMGVTGKVALVGMSMGGCNALNYAVRHPEDVSCVAALIPLTDLAMIRANTSPAIVARYAEIDAIYGAPPAADYTGHSPVGFAGSISAGLPIHIWSSSDDPLVTPAMVDGFLAARPLTGHTVMGALGHDVNHAMIPGLLGFLAKHHLNP